MYSTKDREAQYEKATTQMQILSIPFFQIMSLKICHQNFQDSKQKYFYICHYHPQQQNTGSQQSA